MADTGAQGQPQEGTPKGQQQGQEPAVTDQANGQQAATGQEPGTGQQAPEFDLNTIQDPAVKAYLEKIQADTHAARAEAAKYRTDRNALQQQITEAQRANETAEQKAQREAQERDQELATLRDENKGLKVGSQWTTAATAAKALDPAALLSLIGGVGKIETDDTGKPTNLDDLLATARQQYPWAFSRTAGAEGGAGAGTQGPRGSDMNTFIRGGR